MVLLSLEKSASGTNLTEATHIIIVEPIDDKKIIANFAAQFKEELVDGEIQFNEKCFENCTLYYAN